ncbi:MAG TPA: hypothetical protein VIW25_02570 [Nitrososphaeraceae archaeon]|jgi:hypothetical protein
MIMINALAVVLTGSIGGTLFTSVVALFHYPAIAFNMIMTSRVDIDEPDLVDFIKIGSGIFAVILSALTLTAYRNLKSKRLLFVSTAFGLFAVQAIVSKIDLFIPGIESSIVEILTSTIIFFALAFFFLAIVKKPKIKSKAATKLSR